MTKHLEAKGLVSLWSVMARRGGAGWGGRGDSVFLKEGWEPVRWCDTIQARDGMNLGQGGDGMEWG